MTDDVNAALEKSMRTLLTLSEVQYKMALSVTEDAKGALEIMINAGLAMISAAIAHVNEEHREALLGEVISKLPEGLRTHQRAIRAIEEFRMTTLGAGRLQ